MEDKELEKTKALNELEMLEEKDDNVEDLILDNMDSPSNNDEVIEDTPVIPDENKEEKKKLNVGMVVAMKLIYLRQKSYMII